MPEQLSDGFWVPSYGEGRYSLPQAKKNENAKLIYKHFDALGWSKNAICAMLGNFDIECRMNPRCWSGEAYGLAQWDPYTKLSNWAEVRGLDYTLGSTQLLYLQDNWENEERWDIHDETDITFHEWSYNTTWTMQRMVHLFRWLYEVADPATEDQRLEWAMYYLNIVGKLPIWLLFKIRDKRRNKLK